MLLSQRWWTRSGTISVGLGNRSTSNRCGVGESLYLHSLFYPSMEAVLSVIPFKETEQHSVATDLEVEGEYICIPAVQKLTIQWAFGRQ